eukprot:TRINITY_DN5777_c0_g1_i1.p1 TRINITY_DN5777_c0_g1~~TRINITY_DN5777_c0_g1_i1.p1  ORF type:complete len:126 (+),score=12.25 TRINITY_DN5777_c0_g1_i1:581-958(+)
MKRSLGEVPSIPPHRKVTDKCPALRCMFSFSSLFKKRGGKKKKKKLGALLKMVSITFVQAVSLQSQARELQLVLFCFCKKEVNLGKGSTSFFLLPLFISFQGSAPCFGAVLKVYSYFFHFLFMSI